VMATDHRARLLRELSDAVDAYRRGDRFLGIETLPDEIAQGGGAWLNHHANAMRSALMLKNDSAVLIEMILILEHLEQQHRT
jgi:hypothetical protein